MMSHATKLTTALLVALTVGISPMSAEDPVNTPLPDRPGIYYESRKGLVPLPMLSDPGETRVTTEWKEASKKVPVRATDPSFILFLSSPLTESDLHLIKADDLETPQIDFSLASVDESKPLYRLSFSGTLPPGTYAILRPAKAEPGAAFVDLIPVLVFTVKP